ncbi:MAG TPA: energy transducer TonB [Crocinitomix sp.]|nr:energy transducer TonB [Crocinitomix sp.]
MSNNRSKQITQPFLHFININIFRHKSCNSLFVFNHNQTIMIAKKNPKANLENKRFAFFQIGLVIAGGLVLTAFSYANPYFKTIKKQSVDDVIHCEFPEIPTEIVFKLPQQKQKQPKIPIVDEVIEVKKVVNEQTPKIVNEIIDEIDVIDEQGGGDNLPGLPISDEPYVVVEEWPEFPGGDAEMYKFITNNIEIPEYALAMSGLVYVRFIVDKDGTITNVQVLKGIHKDYDSAAAKVVSKMPKWKPGKQAGKTVRVQYEIPIRFRH